MIEGFLLLVFSFLNYLHHLNSNPLSNEELTKYFSYSIEIWLILYYIKAFFWVFQDRVFLCNVGCPGTHFFKMGPYRFTTGIIFWVVNLIYKVLNTIPVCKRLLLVFSIRCRVLDPPGKLWSIWSIVFWVLFKCNMGHKDLFPSYINISVAVSIIS